MHVDPKLATRIIRSHEEWVPHGYQVRAVEHLIQQRAAALFLDPGLGKTAVVLAAFQYLQQLRQVNRMLVVAPLRVCQLVWEQEGRKWTQFRDLTFTLLHGPKKEERLREQTDIHLINPEGIAWFSQEFFGRTDLPYDVVTIDELSKFKNSQAARSKKLRTRITRVKYRWGLTGSPAPNGYMDLFGQMLILDDGAALGRYITYFRDLYFSRNFDGFSYDLKPDGAARIEEKIAPYVLRMSSDDYGSLPEQIDNPIPVELSKEARKQYNEMKKEMIISLPEGVVTAANSAAVYTKLAQLANGAVYLLNRDYAVVHDAKLDALEDLIEELAGQQLLVAYEFQHDLARLQERFPNAPTLTGLSHKKIIEVEAAWNNGEIPVLFAHPASAGHGLNLQGSGASHLCWYSKPWDLDLYNQFIRRLRRQGTTAQHIMNHSLVVKDSIDEIKDEALKDKDVTEQRLLRALNAEVIRDVIASDVTNAVGEYATKLATPKGDEMGLKKLGFQNQGAAAAAAGEAAKPAPRGWGGAAAGEQTEIPNAAAQQQATAKEVKTPRGWGNPAGAAPDPQREAISNKLRAPAPEPEPDGDEEQPPASVRALAAFPSDVVQQLTGTAPAAEGAERAETTAAGEAASGRPLPPGWGPVSTESGAKADDPRKEAVPPAETTAKRPSRARKTVAEASEGSVGSSENTLIPGTNTHGFGVDLASGPDRTAYRGAGNEAGLVIDIQFTGLPRRVVAAALASIAAEYAKEV